MKKILLLTGTSALFLGIALLTSCEGPAGIAGKDADDTCTACHSSSDKIEKSAQFSSSQHKDGGIAVDYAGGRGSCAQCHSSEGFIEFASLGKVEGDIANPSAWTCKTCHDLHNAFDTSDWALRLDGPVTALYNNTSIIDFGNSSNLCASCHQTRTAEPNIAKPGATFAITSTHYGPHHGPQANVLAGIGFAEIAGSAAYPAAGSSVHFASSCIGCHMGPYDGEEDAGGHTWHANLQNCNECHATTDFDYGGVQTDVEEQLVELRDILLAQGVMGSDTTDGVVSYHPVVATHSMVQAQAFFNWVGIEEDRSLGVHNPKYVDALLKNTIEAVK